MCRMYRPKTIVATCIVGSIGKTTTKKMVQAVYQSQEATLCDAGNDNQLDCVGYICQHIPGKTKLWIRKDAEGNLSFGIYERTMGFFCSSGKMAFFDAA